MLNDLRNHGFRQSADFRIFAEKPLIFDEFYINSAVFIKNAVHFSQPAIISDFFDAKTPIFLILRSK